MSPVQIRIASAIITVTDIETAKLMGHDSAIISLHWNPEPGMVFVDIGTGPGTWTLYSLAKGCRVFAIDPKTDAMKIVTEQAKLNGFEPIFINKGCWSSRGLIQFGLNSCLAPDDPPRTLIEVVTLDEISKSSNFDRCDCINMDAEFAEVEIVKGGLKTLARFKPKLIIEVHKKEFVREIIELIRHIGYSFSSYENFLIAEVK